MAHEIIYQHRQLSIRLYQVISAPLQCHFVEGVVVCAMIKSSVTVKSQTVTLTINTYNSHGSYSCSAIF
ncbi:unnamed protein product [Rotaria socialis]